MPAPVDRASDADGPFARGGRRWRMALRLCALHLLVSSDFEEVERICHRALVFDRGPPAVELSRDALTVARLTEAASGEVRRAAEA